MATGAGVYVRVSTVGQATKGTSLAGQREVCRRLVSGRGWALAGEYVDRGVSGARWSRPGLDRLLDDVRAGVVSVVVVAGLDRLGRSVRHLLSLLGEWDDVGVGFVSVAEGFDSTAPEGRLLRGVLGAFAEFEREQIVERAGPAGRRWPGRGGGRAGCRPLGGGWPGRAVGVAAAWSSTRRRRPPSGPRWPACWGRAPSPRRPDSSTLLGRPTRRGAPWTAAAVRSAVTGSKVGEILDEASRGRLAARIRRRSGPGGSRWRVSAVAGSAGLGVRGGHGRRRRGQDRPQLRLHGTQLGVRVWAGAGPAVGAGGAGRGGRPAGGGAAQRGGQRRPPDLRARIAAIEAALVAEVAAHICRGSPGQVAAEATAAMVAELERLRACLAQAERTRGRHEATVRLAGLGQRPLADGQSTPQLAADLVVGLDVRVRILGTVGCTACAGGGKAPGGGGWRCPACRGVRQRPTVRVAGVLPKWRRERNQGDRPFEIDISV